MIEICDRGLELLTQGIVKQAVDDYIKYRLELDFLRDTKKGIIKVIKEDSKKYPKIYTLDDAFGELQYEIDKKTQQINECVSFFHSELYRSMCDIDGAYMIAKTIEKYEEAKAEIQEKTEVDAKKRKRRKKTGLDNYGLQ